MYRGNNAGRGSGFRHDTAGNNDASRQFLGGRGSGYGQGTTSPINNNAAGSDDSDDAQEDYHDSVDDDNEEPIDDHDVSSREEAREPEDSDAEDPPLQQDVMDDMYSSEQAPTQPRNNPVPGLSFANLNGSREPDFPGAMMGPRGGHGPSDFDDSGGF
jgi:hypothetical protein